MASGCRMGVATARVFGAGALRAGNLQTAVSRLLMAATLPSTGVAAVLLATPHFAASDIDGLPARVRRLLPAGTPLVGAVVDAIGRPGAAGCSLSLISMPPESSLSVTAFVAPSARPQARRSKAVGRWPDLSLLSPHAAAAGPGRGPVAPDVIDSNEPGAFQTISKGPVRLDAVASMADASLTAGADADAMLLFTDDEPDEIADALVRAGHSCHSNDHLTSLIGITGARTPFMNGKPHTLFFNDDICVQGAVGLAFHGVSGSSGSSGSASIGQLVVDTSAFVNVSDPIPITRARGNIILELGRYNAARYFLRDVEDVQRHHVLENRPDQQQQQRSTNSHITRENTVYIRVEDPRREPVDGRPWSTVCAVSGGDMAKGTLAVDTSMDLEAGMTITVVKLGQGGDASRADGQTWVGFGTLSTDEEGANRIGDADADAEIEISVGGHGGAIVGFSTRGVVVGGRGYSHQRHCAEVVRVPGVWAAMASSSPSK